MPQQTRRCHKCGTIKPADAFYVIARGLSSYCRECCALWSHEKRIGKKSERTRRCRLSPLHQRAAMILGNIRKRERQKGRAVTVRLEWLRARFDDFAASRPHDAGAGRPFSLSIDRLDRTRGYDESNVRVVWLIENLCRNRFSDEDVLEFCRRKLNQSF